MDGFAGTRLERSADKGVLMEDTTGLENGMQLVALQKMCKGSK